MAGWAEWSSAASTASGFSSTKERSGQAVRISPTTPRPALLPEARRLIFAGKYGEANNLVGSRMMARPLGQLQYQTLGDLMLQFPAAREVGNYRRDLNLDTATATIAYQAGGVRFTREVFAVSGVDGVMVIRLTADKPGQISFTATLKTPHKATVTLSNTATRSCCRASMGRRRASPGP